MKKNKLLSFLFAYNNYRHIKNYYYNDLTTLEEVLTTNPGDQDTTRFDLINTRGTFGKNNDYQKINYEAGYDFNIETGWGQRIEDGKRHIGDYAFFATAEFSPIKHVTVRPGFRYGYNTAFTYRPVPSMHLKFNIPIRHEGHSLVFRTSYAYGYRAPTLKELYLYFVDVNHDIIGNPDLHEEYSHNFNLATTYTGIMENIMMRIDLSMSYNDINDQIALVRSSLTQYSYANIDKFKTLIFKLSTEWGVRDLRLSVGGAYLGTYNEESETKEDVPTFSYSPEISASAIYEFKKINLSAAVFYKYTGRELRYAIDKDDGQKLYQTYVSAYHTADVTLAKYFWKKRIKVSVGAKNLFDVRSITNTVTDVSAHSSGRNAEAIGTGRTYFLGLDLKFGVK